MRDHVALHDLHESMFQRLVPRLPHRVVVRRRQSGVRNGPHTKIVRNAHGKEEVAEKRRDEQFLSEKLLE